MKKFFQFFKNNEKMNTVLFWTAILLVPMLCMLIPDFVRSGFTAGSLYADFWYAKYVILLCALMFSGLLLALTALVRRVAIPAGILMLVSLVAGFANTQKLIYRDAPVLPSDFLLLRDGMTAARQFSLVFSKTLIVLIILCLLIVILLIPVRFPGKRSDSKKVKALKAFAYFLIGGTVCVGLLFGVSFNRPLRREIGYRLCPKQPAVDYTYNTFYPAFLNLVPDTIVRAPADYNRNIMDEIGDGIVAVADKTATGKQADIVILQVESFFIPDQYDLVYNKEDVYGELFSLAESSASGELISPLVGGGTADVEFEMLTGFTSNDNQITANPFSVFTYPGIPNIVGYLGTRGYETVSVHSYTTSLYNRINAYLNLGFDKSIFIDSFEDPEYRGNWVTDSCCIEKAIEEYETMQDGGRLLHIVTMQNHVPVQWDAYEDSELVQVSSSTLSGDDLKTARIFLTSCREICRAIRRFVDYLDGTGRDVVLVIYGDHQVPILRGEEDAVSISIPVRTDLTENDSDLYALTHGTPFYVHTTFESGIGGQSWGRLAPNSILVKALCEVGIARPAYFQYLYESQSVVKSLTGDYAILQDETIVQEFTEEMSSDLRIRRLIQHDIVRGKRYILEQMYG